MADEPVADVVALAREVEQLTEALDASLARRLYVEEEARQAQAEVERLRGLLAESVRLMELVDPGYLPESDQEKANDWWGDATEAL